MIVFPGDYSNIAPVNWPYDSPHVDVGFSPAAIWMDGRLLGSWPTPSHITPA